MLSKTEFKSLPVFITSMSRWDGDTSSASLALAKVLSRTTPVYYIDFPYSCTDYWQRRKQPSVVQRKGALLRGRNYLRPLAQQGQNLVAVTPRLVLPFYNLKPGAAYQMASHYNNTALARLIKKIVREKGIGEYLFLNSFNPSYFANVGRYLQPALSIYQSRDAIEETHEYSISREDDCVRRYDLTVATSTQICKNIESRTGIKAAYLPNGGDVKLFKTAIEKVLRGPAELQNVRTPIIGYTGAVCQRMDYELLVKLAEAHPDKTIVLVGPRRDHEYTDIKLDAVKNIVFTGPKKLEELPAYLQRFDCAVIPFKCNKLTAGIYPLKINEYLAAGRAVVTTHFSADVAAFRSHVYLSDTHEAFLQNVQRALNDNGKGAQERRSYAASLNSWEGRAEDFWELAWAAYQKKHRRMPLGAGLVAGAGT